jgi:hypothetical protein
MITVTVKDRYGNDAVSYTGMVHFTSSDDHADLPEDYTFTIGENGDNGSHTFTTVLRTAGTQSISVTNIGNGANGARDKIHITPSVAVAILVAGYPLPVAAGSLNFFTVTAMDEFGNPGAIYLGTVHFTSSDSDAQLPLDYTFAPQDNGGRTFAASLDTVGIQSITATDTLDETLTSTQDGIEVVTGGGAPGNGSGSRSWETFRIPQSWIETYNSRIGTAISASGNEPIYAELHRQSGSIEQSMPQKPASRSKSSGDEHLDAVFSELAQRIPPRSLLADRLNSDLTTGSSIFS